MMYEPRRAEPERGGCAPVLVVILLMLAALWLLSA
jgi:hypothetical protein